MFAATAQNTLFESDDGGRSWTTLNPPALTCPRQNPSDRCGRASWLKASTALQGHSNRFDLFFDNAYNVIRQTCTDQGGLNCNNPWSGVTINFRGLHDPNGFSFDASGNNSEISCHGRWGL